MMKTLQICILLALAAAVLCTNTSAPLLDPVWSADLLVREEGSNSTGNGFVQFKYDENHQFIYDVISFMDQKINVAWWLVEDVVGILWTVEKFQCTHNAAAYELTIPRDVLQTATYMKTTSDGFDIFLDGRTVEGSKAIFYMVKNGTSHITQLYIESTDPNQLPVTMFFSNHGAKIDRKWMDVHATCPVIQE